jgi:hypothetical protein
MKRNSEMAAVRYNMVVYRLDVFARDEEEVDPCH